MVSSIESTASPSAPFLPHCRTGELDLLVGLLFRHRRRGKSARILLLYTAGPKSSGFLGGTRNTS